MVAQRPRLEPKGLYFVVNYAGVNKVQFTSLLEENFKLERVDGNRSRLWERI